jgi:alcohol dehydrogenase (cytochrome c)
MLAICAMGVCVACVAADPVASATSAAPVPAARAATPGKTLYSQNCARCHGFSMVNPGPGVFDLRTFPRGEKARFVASVSEGKGAMPAWKSALTAADIDALWTYVTTSSRR